MIMTDLKLGTSILVDIERGGIYYTLKSKVMDTSDEGIYIAPPYDKRGDISEFRERDKVYIRYARNSKSIRWECDSWEDALVKEQKYVYVTSTKVAENDNKREALRLEVGKDTSLTKVKTGKETNVYLKDISLVGVAFISEDTLQIGDLFDLRIDDLNLDINLRVRVVREEKTANKFTYGCIVTKSDASLRKYISGRQQEEIRKTRSI